MWKPFVFFYILVLLLTGTELPLNKLGLRPLSTSDESRIVSEVSDMEGDTSVRYLDVVRATILQVNSELVQFNMIVNKTIPISYSLGTYVAFIWLLDVDQNAATGQPHEFVGSEYNVRVAFSDGSWRGYVDVNTPGIEGGEEANVFIEACTVSILLSKAQIGGYCSFAWEIVAFAYGEVEGGDSADEYSHASLNLDDPSPTQIYEVIITPTFLTYTKGELSDKIQLLVFNVERNRLETTNASFFIPETSIASYSSSSTLNVQALGSASIVAKTDGVVSSNKATLMCGKAQLAPPILLLSTEGNSSGHLYLDIELPNGTNPSINDLDIEFYSSNPDVATVNSEGLVTAVRPPKAFNETPYIGATIGNFFVDNAAVIRVTENDLPIQLTSYGGNHVNFSTAETFGPYNWGTLMEVFEAVRVSDIVYEISNQLTGVTPWHGQPQFLVLDPGNDSDGTVPCGLSGNPIRLGLGIDNLRSCFGGIENLQWGVWYHEMGHNFASPMRSELCRVGHGYEEAIATAVGMFCVDFLLSRAEQYGLPREIITALNDSNCPLLPAFGRRVFLEALQNYIENGCNYHEINADILAGMFLTLQNESGLDVYYNFFSTIYSEAPIYTNIYTEERQATFLAAALSASTGRDQRNRFRNDWGFPINDTFYDSIWEELNRRIDLRGPDALIGKDIWAHAGTIVQLDGNSSYDRMGSKLSFRWTLVSKPSGSNATLSNSTLSNPVILLDSLGEYTASLTVSNILKSSNPATVKIHVVDYPIISILSPQNSTYQTSSVSLIFAIDDEVSWIGYSLDYQTNETIIGNITLPTLVDGMHNVVVYASDIYGNMGQSSTVHFTVDTTKPNIAGVIQDPLVNVLPETRVKINATVTDATSKIEQVLLNCTFTNSTNTWNSVFSMTQLTGDIWNGTILALPYGTNVTYVIIAEDNVGNTITTEQIYGCKYEYQVVPEFPFLTILLAFMMTTLLIAVVFRKKRTFTQTRALLL